MGLAILIFGLVIFHATHVFVAFRAPREALIAQMGLAPYRILHGLVSLIGVALIAWGFVVYRATGWIDVWYPPAVMRHITVGLMWVAAVLAIAAFVGGHIKAKIRFPMLVSIKTWAFAHLLANGDLGSILIFGSFLAWAIYARIAAKRRAADAKAAPPSGWSRDIISIAVGTLLYLALGYAFHPAVIGVPVFGG